MVGDLCFLEGNEQVKKASGRTFLFKVFRSMACLTFLNSFMLLFPLEIHNSLWYGSDENLRNKNVQWIIFLQLPDPHKECWNFDSIYYEFHKNVDWFNWRRMMNDDVN